MMGDPFWNMISWNILIGLTIGLWLLALWRIGDGLHEVAKAIKEPKQFYIKKEEETKNAKKA